VSATTIAMIPTNFRFWIADFRLSDRNQRNAVRDVLVMCWGPNLKSKIENLKLVHLITLSARASTFGGIVRPIYFAVLRLITNSNFVDSLYRYCLPLCLSMTLSANTAIELLPQLVASVLSAQALSILKPLLQNRLFSQGIVVAGSVKVDDIPVTWILKDWTSPVKGLFLDCRKFQMAKAAGRISDFGNDTLTSP